MLFVALGGWGGDRQGQRKGGALTRPAFNPNPPAVKLDERPGDVEAEAGALLAALERVGGASEGLEEAGLVFGRDARPLVLDGNPNEAGFRGEGE
jgi:hypothetical protein